MTRQLQQLIGVFFLGLISATAMCGNNGKPESLQAQPVTNIACTPETLIWLRDNVKNPIDYQLMKYGCGDTASTAPTITKYFVYDRLFAKRYAKYCNETDPNALKPYCVYNYNNSEAVD